MLFSSLNLAIPTSPENGLIVLAVSHLLLYTALLTPSAMLSHKSLSLFFLPPLTLLDYFAHRCSLTTIALVHTLWCYTLLLFHSPRESFSVLHFLLIHTPERRRADEDGDGDEEEEERKGSGRTAKGRYGAGIVWRERYPQTGSEEATGGFWDRLCWVNKLVCSPRFVGWDVAGATVGGGEVERGGLSEEEEVDDNNNNTVPNVKIVTSRQPVILPNREGVVWKLIWILWRMVILIIAFVVWDLSNYYQSLDSYFLILTDIDQPLPRHLREYLRSWYLGVLPPRAIRLAVFAVQQYLILELTFTFLAIVFVALGVLGIVDDFWAGTYNWTPVLGNPSLLFRQGGGVRVFWGRFWYQFSREIFSAPSRFLADNLGLASGTLCWFFFRILTTFLVSGLFYYITTPSRSSHRNPSSYLLFFLLNGVAVIVEILVSPLIVQRFAMRRFSRRSRWLGLAAGVGRLAWVGAVLWWTGPLFLDEFVKDVRESGVTTVFLFPLAKIDED